MHSAKTPKPRLQRMAEALMVLALVGMVVAVFINVVLRYVFNTSIVSYEEISRLLFVWLVAVGSIVAAFEGSHLGFDLVTARVGPNRATCPCCARPARRSAPRAASSC